MSPKCGHMHTMYSLRLALFPAVALHGCSGHARGSVWILKGYLVFCLATKDYINVWLAHKYILTPNLWPACLPEQISHTSPIAIHTPVSLTQAYTS